MARSARLNIETKRRDDHLRLNDRDLHYRSVAKDKNLVRRRLSKKAMHFDDMNNQIPVRERGPYYVPRIVLTPEEKTSLSCRLV